MRKSTFLACVLYLMTALAPALVADSPLAADSPPAAEPPLAADAAAVIVDKAFARELLMLAKTRDESDRSFVIMERLHGLEREEIVQAAALVREELGAKAPGATEVPPRSHLHGAWLLNYLDAHTETLAFDLAEDGSFVRWLEPGKSYRFRTFDKQELVVHINESTIHYDALKNSLKAYSRLYLRQIPGSDDYYAAVWKGLSKHRQSPPPPNPDGRYIPSLMNQFAKWP